MRLTALRLHNVRRFGGHGIAIEGIGDGVNVLTAVNEFGKSTAFEALHALFFQPHSGTGKTVQLLRPYSGGNPLIEADITTVDGQFRVTKQFYGGRRAEVRDLATGRLIKQADEAETFINALTRGGSTGPAGLLWVRQGITGMETQSSSERESGKRVRETLLSSVQGEVEALTGGRRMAEILAACEAELFTLVTATGQPKKHGLYASAIEARDRLVAEEARLKADVTILRNALDKRRAARLRLDDIEQPEEQAARRAAILAAEAALETARSHGEALKAAEAEAALAQHRYDAASAALAQFDADLHRAEQLETALVDARQRRAAALARRMSATADKDRADQAIDAAEIEEREQRDLLARLDAALRARDAAERLTQLRQQLEKAEAAREQVEQGEARLAVLAISDRSISQLQDIELDLARLQAAQQATLPTYRLDYATGIADAVHIAGAPLPDGAEIPFAKSIQLDLAGIGTLTLRSNRPADADRGIEHAIAKRDGLLAQLKVESLAAARQRQAAAQAKAAELDLARQRLADLAPSGLPRLQADVAELVAASTGDLELKGDADALRQSHAAAEQAIVTHKNAAREIGPRLSEAANGLVAAETALASLTTDFDNLQVALGPTPERDMRRQKLGTEQADCKKSCESAGARVTALRPLAHDLVTAQTSLARLRSVDAAARQETSQLRERIAELNGTINTSADNAIEETWQETGEALDAATANVARFKSEVDILDRLRRSLVTARSAARDLYLKPVVTELKPLLHLLFEDISIVFDEETLLPQSVRRNGQDEDVDRLSGGMREQLSVLTRLAFARLLARDGRTAPVILDDALVYSDDDRIERMFDALHRQAQDQQILVFSCRQRAFSKLGGNVLQMQPWVPPGL